MSLLDTRVTKTLDHNTLDVFCLTLKIIPNGCRSCYFICQDDRYFKGTADYSSAKFELVTYIKTRRAVFLVRSYQDGQ